MGRVKRFLAFFGLQGEEVEQWHPIKKDGRSGADELGEADVDAKAKEYIEKVHHKMEMEKQDIKAEEYINRVHRKMNREVLSQGYGQSTAFTWLRSKNQSLTALAILYMSNVFIM